MTKTECISAVRDLLTLVFDDAEATDIDPLVTALDSVALAATSIVPVFDSQPWPEPERMPYEDACAVVRTRFPVLGLYAQLLDPLDVAGGAVGVGDAVDDLADILLDLAEVAWRWDLLTNKIRHCIKAQPQREHSFRIWVDPIALRYAKADECVELISNHVLAKALGKIRPVDKVITRDSKTTESIQLCDLLLGAVMDAWQQDASSPAKLAVSTAVAQHLGWDDLRADTPPGERKFNIWHFYDKTKGAREPPTRRTDLKYPLPFRR